MATSNIVELRPQSIDDCRTSRRALLGAALTIPAVAAIGGTVAIAASKSQTGAEWYALLSKYNRIDAVKRRVDREFDAAWTAAQAEMPGKPDMTFTIEGIERRFDAQLDIAQLDRPGSALFPQQTKDELRSRWQAYEAEMARINAQFDLNRLGARSDRMAEEISGVRDRLLTMAAPDQEGLMWKIERLFGEDYDDGQESSGAYSMKWIGSFVTDARRLLPDGRA